MSNKQSSGNTVYIVHCVDTEGPLYEDLDISFERLEERFGVTGIRKTQANLAAMRRGEILLGGNESAVAELLNSHLLDFNDSWPKIDAMLDRIMPQSFRRKVPDSDGNGWVFSWHCMDHVNFANNPRRRAMGYHAIFDHYRARLAEFPESGDGLHFHFHPMSTYADAHHCATSYVNSPHLWETISRRIIERNWFPTAYRAGFQTERPDSHWFLEQWIPFDLSNMAVDDPSEFDRLADFRNGRSGDWRRAPADWSIYQPSHDDYQVPGNCRRWIARALNVMNRIASIDQREVDKAFLRAASGTPTLLAVATHDFRDLGREVEFLTGLIQDARGRMPGVRVQYCEAVDAFRRVQGMSAEECRANALDLDIRLERAPAGDCPRLTITARNGVVFGPQPWLAIETMGRRFIHDNLDFDLEPGRWHYAFHGDTLPLDDVRYVGVGAADRYGNFSVKVINVAAGDAAPR